MGQPIRRRGLQRNPVILLQLSCPWRVGAQGREGEEGVKKNIPQAFLAPARDRVGSKRKEEEEARKADDSKSVKARLLLWEDLCLEIQLDPELADRGLKCGAWTTHWDGKGTLSLRMGLKSG